MYAKCVRQRFTGYGAAQSGRSEPLGRARAACFERLAGVYASRGAGGKCIYGCGNQNLVR